MLSFVSAPDFEAPTDAGSDNVYDVQVQVSDGTNTDIQDIAVTVTNVSGSSTGNVWRRHDHGFIRGGYDRRPRRQRHAHRRVGADTIDGGLGADAFVIGTVAALAAGETIDGTAEAGTIDTLRLDAAGTYNLSTFTTISNIDAIALNENAAGFSLTVANSQVSTADADGNGTQAICRSVPRWR